MPRRRGAKAYFLGSGVAQACALVRYTVLARLLGPEQLGLAATLMLTSQFFGSITDSGSDRYLIQDRDGDSPALQGLVQLVFAGRGVLIALGLVLCAEPLAGFYHAPKLADGLAVLALAPLIFGFYHLDMRRSQRHNDFRSEAMAMTLGESASLVATVIAAFLTHSFTAILYGLIVRAIVYVVVSHLYAERRYSLKLAWDRAPALAKFSAPLMVNGLILFFGGQGDRLIVVNRLGMAAMGQYSAVLLLILYPSSMLIRYMSTMHLPSVATDIARGDGRRPAIERLAGQVMLLGLAMAAGFLLVGPTAVAILFGAKFKTAALTVCLIGLLQVARFSRIWPTTVAMGMGQSGIVLANNVARLFGFPLAIGLVMMGGGLDAIVGGLTIGELLGLVTGILMINRALGRAWSFDLDRFGLLLLGAATLIASVFAVEQANPLAIAVALGGAVVTVWRATSREWETIRDAAALGRRWLRRTPMLSRAGG